MLPPLCFTQPSTVAKRFPTWMGLALHRTSPVFAVTGLIKLTLISIVEQLKPFCSVDRTKAVIVVSSSVDIIPP